MNTSFLISTNVLALMMVFFIILICFIKHIFLTFGGTKFSIVKLELIFLVTFLIYNLLYFFFVFIIISIKNKVFYYDSFIVDKAFRKIFLLEIYSTIDVYFLLIVISFCASWFFLALDINKEYDKDKIYILCLYFLIYFIYWFFLFSCTFFLFISFFIK